MKFEDIKNRRQGRANGLTKKAMSGVSNSLSQGVDNLQRADVSIAEAIALIKAWNLSDPKSIERLEQARQSARSAQEMLLHVREED
jgi:hypothetical protein